MSGMSMIAAAIALAVATFTTPTHAQYYDPDYPHEAFIPYGRGGPQYRGDYYGTYRNPIPWYTAPSPRNSPGPYPEYLGRPYPRSYTPYGDWRWRRY